MAHGKSDRMCRSGGCDHSTGAKGSGNPAKSFCISARRLVDGSNFPMVPSSQRCLIFRAHPETSQHGFSRSVTKENLDIGRHSLILRHVMQAESDNHVGHAVSAKIGLASFKRSNGDQASKPYQIDQDIRFCSPHIPFSTSFAAAEDPSKSFSGSGNALMAHSTNKGRRLRATNNHMSMTMQRKESVARAGRQGALLIDSSRHSGSSTFFIFFRISTELTSIRTASWVRSMSVGDVVMKAAERTMSEANRRSMAQAAVYGWGVA